MNECVEGSVELVDAGKAGPDTPQRGDLSGLDQIHQVGQGIVH